MTTLLSSQALSLENNQRVLFQNLNLSVRQGEKIALVGHNGSGKTSLLRVLAQSGKDSQGQLHYAHDCRLQWVQQHLPASLQAMTVAQALATQLDACASEQWRVNAMLERLSLQEQADNLVTQLSGGQHTRLMLALALLHEPNLLLLDEPGNHLDLPSLIWLENFLREWRGALVLVSHDLNLLDNVCQQSWILRDQTVYHFQLNPTQALVALDEADQAAQLRRADEQKEIQRLQASSQRLAIWGREYDNEGLVRKAKSMQKRIVKLEEQQSFVSAGSPWSLQLHGQRLHADYVLQLEDFAVSAAAGLQSLYQIDFLQLRSQDKLAVLGANGLGKSSLLRQCWQSWQSQQESASCRFHPALRMAYYDQSLQRLPEQANLLEAIYSIAAVPETQRRHALINAGFEYVRHSQLVASLSGGERARLMLLAFSLGDYHVLLLDEPTNHLDLEGKRELAQALRSYQGAVMLVSHDRDFLRLCCQRFLVLSQRGLREWDRAELAYAAIAETALLKPPATVYQQVEASVPENAIGDAKTQQDAISALDLWCQLEALLQADLARKPRHQKPELQRQWRAQMAELERQLESVTSLP